MEKCMFPKAELRATSAAVALLASLLHSARLRSPARHFGGPELRGGKAVGRRLSELQPQHAGSCSRGPETLLIENPTCFGPLRDP